MKEPKPRVYTIRVQQVVIFYDSIEVTAAAVEEACHVAVEEFQCDWSKSEEVGFTTQVIAVEES